MEAEKVEMDWNGVSIMQQENGETQLYLLFQDFEIGAVALNQLLQINPSPLLILNRLENGTHDIFIGFSQDVFMKGNFGMTLENYPNLQLMQVDDIDVIVIAGARDGDIVMGSDIRFKPHNFSYVAN